MEALELAKLVAKMRSAQREYFRRRTPAALEESKRLEKDLDLAVAKILVQPRLFPEAPGAIDS